MSEQEDWISPAARDWDGPARYREFHERQKEIVRRIQEREKSRQLMPPGNAGNDSGSSGSALAAPPPTVPEAGD